MTHNSVTVYWAPAPFTTVDASWNMLYKAPRSLSSQIKKENKHKGTLGACPASNGILKNIFSLHSAIEEDFELPVELLKDLAYENIDTPQQVQCDSNLAVNRVRESSIDGHVNLTYNLGWTFFAEEPLMMRVTAPYYPPKTPVPNASLAAGEYDIGKWYRSVALDYHVPLEPTNFKIEVDDPLMYVEFFTDKKVILKRYTKTPEIKMLEEECANSPMIYGRNKPLEYRYSMAMDSELSKRLLKEISKSVVE